MDGWMDDGWMNRMTDGQVGEWVDTHPLLLPHMVAEAVVKATGSRRPLGGQPADASLHEAQRLLAPPHLLQQGAHVRAERRLSPGQEVALRQEVP